LFRSGFFLLSPKGSFPPSANVAVKINPSFCFSDLPKFSLPFPPHEASLALFMSPSGDLFSGKLTGNLFFFLLLAASLLFVSWPLIRPSHWERAPPPPFA